MRSRFYIFEKHEQANVSDNSVLVDMERVVGLEFVFGFHPGAKPNSPLEVTGAKLMLEGGHTVKVKCESGDWLRQILGAAPSGQS